MTMKVITLINEKGGVGKTTLASHIAVGLALRGKRVVAIDADAQGNLTYVMGLPEMGNLYRLLIQEGNWNDLLIEPKASVWREGYQTHGQLYVLPGNKETRGINLATEDLLVLSDRLAELEGHMDYVVIDTAPTPSLFQNMFYLASDYLIYPTQAQSLSIYGVGNTRKNTVSINRTRETLGLGKAVLLGVVPNMLDRRTLAHKKGLELLAKNMGENMILPALSELTAWREAEFMRQTIFTYAPNSDAATEMWEVIDAVQVRLKQAEKAKKGTA